MEKIQKKGKPNRNALFPAAVLAFIWRALHKREVGRPFPAPSRGRTCEICSLASEVLGAILLMPRGHHHGVHEGVLPPVEAIMAAGVLIGASAPREVYPWGDDPPKDGGLSASVLFTADVASGFRRIAHSLLPSPPSPIGVPRRDRARTRPEYAATAGTRSRRIPSIFQLFTGISDTSHILALSLPWMAAWTGYAL